MLLLKAGRALYFIKGISQSFYYVPSALLLYFIMRPIIEKEMFTFWSKAYFELLIIVLIAIPNTSILIKEELKLIEREEFITSAKLMGGSFFRILRKHMMPHLWPKLLLIFVQQVIAVLILLAHLGILGIFFGGTTEREFGMEFMIKASDSNEWSGLLGGYYYQMRLAPWLVFFPVFSFGAVILAFNFMAEGIKRAGRALPGRKKVKKSERIHAERVPQQASFTFLSNQKTG
jgi:peptide/nickel transport system permease protein